MPEIGVKLTGDNTEYRSMIDDAVSSTETFAERVAEIGTGMLAAFGAEAILEKIKELFTESIQEAERLHNLSVELGVSTDAIQSFGAAVRETGGSSDAAQKTWEHLRLSLDQLNDGTKSAVDAFARLGLSAEDFVGLSLDQALEKVANAYAANADAAGAYDGIATILGKRTLPQVLQALKDVSTEGLDEVTKKFKDLGVVISSDDIDAVHSLSWAFSWAWDNLKKGATELIADLIRIGESIDALATGNLTALKEVWVSRHAEMKASTEDVKKSVDKEGEAQTAVTQTIKEKKGTLDDATEAQLAILKPIEDEVTKREKLKVLAQEETVLMLAAGSAVNTQVEREAALTRAKQVQLEIDRLTGELAKQEVEQRQKAVDLQMKYNQKRDDAYNDEVNKHLPLEKQLYYAESERAALLDDMAKHNKDSAMYKTDYLELVKTEKDIETINAQLNKDKTAELQKQLAALNAIEAKVNQLYAEARDANAQQTAAHMTEFGGVQLPQYTQEQLNNLSPDVLAEIAKRAKQGIDQLESTKYTSASTGAEMATNFFYRSSAEDILQTTINQVMLALSQRSSLTGQSRQQALSEYQGSLLQFDSAFSMANTSGTEKQQATTNALLQELKNSIGTISDTITGSGLFGG